MINKNLTQIKKTWYSFKFFIIRKVFYGFYTEMAVQALLYVPSSILALPYRENKHSLVGILRNTIISIFLSILILTEFKCLHCRNSILSAGLFQFFSDYLYYALPGQAQHKIYHDDMVFSAVVGTCRQIGVISISFVISVVLCIGLFFFMKRRGSYSNETKWNYVHNYILTIISAIILIVIGKYIGFIYVGFDSLPLWTYNALKWFLVYLQVNVFNVPLNVDIPVNMEFVKIFSDVCAYGLVFIGFILCNWIVLIFTGPFYEIFPRTRFDKADEEEREILQKYAAAINKKVKQAAPNPVFEGRYTRIVYDIIPSKKWRKIFLKWVLPKDNKTQ